MNIMMKPVSGHCNIGCGYCFYREGHTCGGRMSAETTRISLDRLSAFLRGGYPLVFQGGEPLLAGHAWFGQMFAYLGSKGMHPQVFVQTNGTLLDEAYARMFAENQVLVGISLDGDRETHGIHRSDFDAVMRGIRYLRQYGCEFNILTVVTDGFCGRLAESYEFYRREGFEFQQYIPCMAPVGADPWMYLSEKSYGRFLVELYRLWRRDFENGRYVYIRYFENILRIIAGLLPEECGAAGTCSEQLLVESDGSVYPCDFFVEERYRLGNLRWDGLEDIWQRLRGSGFIPSSGRLSGECRECVFLQYCRGGCRRYRSGGKYIYCNAVRHFLEEALPDMIKLLENAHAGSGA